MARVSLSGETSADRSFSGGRGVWGKVDNDNADAFIWLVITFGTQAVK